MKICSLGKNFLVDTNIDTRQLLEGQTYLFVFSKVYAELIIRVR